MLELLPVAWIILLGLVVPIPTFPDRATVLNSELLLILKILSLLCDKAVLLLKAIPLLWFDAVPVKLRESWLSPVTFIAKAFAAPVVVIACDPKFGAILLPAIAALAFISALMIVF